MSFLNPVNEPVLRFKSTDADAPQINYAARTAGDVKAVLKACLVTGYGDKASAGWSVVNEVDHVAEFVSPSAAMSDYRLGINDTSASSTTWYYNYQGARTNPSNNTPTKSFINTNNTSPSNGWQLLVTARGVFYIEVLFSSLAQDLTTRITYWGQNKSALNDTGVLNIAFFNEGHRGSDFSYKFFNNALPNHSIAGRNTLRFFGATPFVLESTNLIPINDYTFGVSNVDIVSALYLTDGSVVVGQQVGILMQVINQKSQMYGVFDESLDGRPVLKLCIGYHGSDQSFLYSRARNALIYLDYWEY